MLSLTQLQVGLISPGAFKREIVWNRSRDLAISRDEDVDHVFSSAIYHMDIEKCENRYLLSGCLDGSIYIHDLYNTTGNQQYVAPSVAHVLAKSKYTHAGTVECTTWFPTDNRFFISSGGDGIMKLWDANILKPFETFKSKGRRVYNHHLSWSCNLVAVGSLSGVELMDLRTGHRSQELMGHRGPTYAVVWSPRDAPMLATTDCTGRAWVWDIRSAGGPLFNLKSGGGEKAHRGYINSMAFTPDGLHLVTLGSDHQLRLWNSSKGQHMLVNYGRIKNDASRNAQIAIGPGLVYVPSKGVIRVLEMWTGEGSTDLRGHFNRVTCCLYREAYQELYSGGSDNNVLVWKKEIPVDDTDVDNPIRDAWSDEGSESEGNG